MIKKPFLSWIEWSKLIIIYNKFISRSVKIFDKRSLGLGSVLSLHQPSFNPCLPIKTDCRWLVSEGHAPTTQHNARNYIMTNWTILPRDTATFDRPSSYLCNDWLHAENSDVCASIKAVCKGWTSMQQLITQFSIDMLALDAAIL